VRADQLRYFKAALGAETSKKIVWKTYSPKIKAP
jgi:hypothetical protein